MPEICYQGEKVDAESSEKYVSGIGPSKGYGQQGHGEDVE